MYYLLLLALTACAIEPKYELSVHTEWITPPTTIEICDDLNIKHEKIFRALHEWYSLNENYSYDTVTYSDCSQPPVVGTIRFTNADSKKLREKSWVAYTSYDAASIIEETSSGKYNKVTYITAAIVHLKPGNRYTTVLHEIGHAWGWSHAINIETGEEAKTGHTMARSSHIKNLEGLEVWPIPTSYISYY